MKRVLPLLLVLVGCVPDHGNNPGSDPGTGNPVGSQDNPDAAPIIADASLGGATGKITGRLCLASSVLTTSPCTALTGTALKVSLVQTGQEVDPAPDGTFSLDGYLADSGAGLVTVTINQNDLTYYPSAVNITVDAHGGASSVVLPILTINAVQAMADDNDVTLSPDSAVLVLHILGSGGTALAGVTTGDLAGTFQFYDDNDPSFFSSSAPTGVDGTVLYFGALPGPNLVTAQTATLNGTFNVAPLEATLTFVTIVLH